MKVIAKSGTNTFLLEATWQEIDFLAGRQIGFGPEGYHDRGIYFGTTFDITKAFQQIHRNDQRKQEINVVRKTLEGIINSLDIIGPFIEEPKIETPEPVSAAE